MGRRILIVSYFYPPRNMIGARRPHALAKYLRRLGHDVTVLTTVHSGRGPDGAAQRLLRTRDLLATPLNWRRANLDLASGGGSGDWQPGFPEWMNALMPVPDPQLVSWVPFALPAARRLQRRVGFDAVITTAPTHSTHLIGRALQRAGVAWIADLRDGWRFEQPNGRWPLAAQRALDDALERRVLGRADAAVGVTDPIAHDVRDRLAVPAHTITNGFDPDDAPPEGAAAPVRPGRLTFACTGTLGRNHTLRPVLEALARLTRAEAGLAERIEVLVAGPRTAEERELYERPDLAPFVRHLGFVPRADALALQRSADVLLLATAGRSRPSEATGKLFEYLAAERPILVLGDGTEAARIVEDACAGWAIPVGDVDAAGALVRRILAGERPPEGGGSRDRYLYPAIADRYAEVVEEAIARRRGR